MNVLPSIHVYLIEHWPIARDRFDVTTDTTYYSEYSPNTAHFERTYIASSKYLYTD